MPAIDITKTAFNSVRNLELPKAAEQMRVGSQLLDWTAGNPYTFDLQYAKYEGVGFVPQAMEIDNSENPASVTLTISNQLAWSRTVLPYQRRTFMVPAMPNLQFSLSASTGGPAPTSTNLYMYNWPAFPDSESEAGSEQFAPDNVDGVAPIATPAFLETISRLTGLNSAGTWDRLRTASDLYNQRFVSGSPGLLGTVARLQGYNYAGGVNPGWEALVTSPGYPDNVYVFPANGLVVTSPDCFYNGVGTNTDRRRYAKQFATAQISAAGSTAIFTPQAGSYYRLLGYSMEISDDATLAVAGRVTASFEDVAAAIGVAHVFALPAAANAGTGARPVAPLHLGNGYRSAATATPLNVNLTAALATGVINVNVALLVGTDP